MTAAKNETFVIKVYGDDNKVVKECKSVDCELKFGAIRKIMALLKIDNINDSAALFKAICDAWDQLTIVLSECFPDMTDSDWDNVKVNELIPVVIALVKTMFAKMMGMPAESSKN